MKKQTLFIISLLALLVSCGNPSTPSSSITSNETVNSESTVIESTTVETISEVSSSEESSSIDSELDLKKAKEEIEKMMASGEATYSREDLVIKKNSTKVYENYSIYTYDSEKNYEYIYSQISGLSTLEESEASHSKIYNIYYDGDYSYSLDSDSMYLRTSEKKDIHGYSIRFDFSFVESLSFVEKDFSNEVNGIVKATNASKFLKKEVSNVSDITFHAVSNKEKLTDYDISYTQGDYQITYTFKVNYDEHPITLPQSIYIKTA